MLTCRGVIRHALKKRFCFCRNTLGPSCHGTECVGNSRPSEPARLLWPPGVQKMSCVCVYSMIMQQHIDTAVYCVLSVQIQRSLSSWQTTMLRIVSEWRWQVSPKSLRRKVCCTKLSTYISKGLTLHKTKNWYSGVIINDVNYEEGHKKSWAYYSLTMYVRCELLMRNRWFVSSYEWKYKMEAIRTLSSRPEFCLYYGPRTLKTLRCLYCALWHN